MYAKSEKLNNYRLGKVRAYVSLTLTPAVTFYLIAQKLISAGLTSGVVKG